VIEPETLPVGESTETHPGVIVERRHVLTTIGAMFAVAGLPSLAHARRLEPRRDA
jgi:hypothetical protein